MELVEILYELLRKYGIWAGIIAVLSIATTLIKAKLNALKIKAEAISIKEKEDELGTKLDVLLGQARTLMGATSPEPKPSVFRVADSAQLEKAEKKIIQAMGIAPNYSRCYYELGTLNARKTSLTLAIDNYKKARKLDRKNPNYCYSLAFAYKLKFVQLFDKFGFTQLSEKGNFLPKISIIYYYYRSLLLFKHAIALAPDFYAAQIQLANLLKIRSPEKAIQQFEKAIRLEPKNKMAYKFLASYLISREEFERAKPIAQLAYQLDQNDEQILSLLTQVFARENNTAKLNEYLGKRSKLADTSVNYASLYEKIQINSIRVDGKIQNIRDHHLYQKIKAPVEMTDDAFKFYLSGDSEKAIQLFSYLASSHPDEAIYPLILCRIAIDNQSVDKANQYLNQVNKLNAPGEEVLIAKIVIKYRQCRFSDVIDLSNEYLKTIDEDGFIRYLLCRSLLHSNQTVDAAREIALYQSKAPHSYDDLLRLAELFDEIDEPDTAEGCIQKAIQLSPDRPEAFIRLCQHSVTIDDYSRLAEYSQAALIRNANKARCDYYNALVLVENGSLDEAIAVLKDCISEQPGDPLFHFELGKIYAHRNDYKGAQDAFNQSLEIAPGYFYALYGLGELSVSAMNYSEALEYFNEALRASPYSISSSFYVAFCHEKLEEIEKAIEHYEYTIELGDKDPATFNNVGTLYEKTNETEKALECYQKTLSLSPDYAPAFFNIGAVHASNKDYLKSIDFLEKACSHAPDKKQNFELLANSYLESQGYQKCLETAEKIIDLDPEDFSGYEYAAKALKALDQFDEAKLAFKKAAACSENRKPEFLNEIGNVYLQEEEFEIARSKYLEIVKHFPKHPVAYLNVGVVYHHQKDFDEALKWYNKSTDADKTYYLAYFNRAHIYYERSNKARAAKELQAAHKYAPENREILNFMGYIQAQLKEYDSALQTLNLCIEISPDYPLPHRNKGNLLKELKRFEEAIPSLKTATELDDSYLDAYQDLFEIYQALELEKEAKKMEEHIQRISKSELQKV